MNPDSSSNAGPSYHDLYITTASIERTRISNLPYGYEVRCNRVSGWELILHNDARGGADILAGEYDQRGLRLDIGGQVIVDSLRPNRTPNAAKDGE